MKQTIFFALFGAVLAVLPARADVDCLKLYLAVKQHVSAEQSKVLEIVSNEVSAAPSCSCEIVKASIVGAEAKPETVAAIVETAATIAPDQMRLIAQCAVAVAPDALAQVQAVLAKLDPNRGNTAHSSKDSKDAKGAAPGETAAMPNPLDFPTGQNPIVGPTLGGPGGIPLIPILPPTIINPPAVTRVNP
jgi:hypothetical protein